MSYSFLEHTADVRMNAEAPELPGLFADALAGMFDLLKPEPDGKEVTRNISLRAPDAAALLVDFLNEALSLAQSHKEAYETVQFETLTETELRAALTGRTVSRFGDDVKAATYHEADAQRGADGIWRARVIFDL